MYSCSYASTGFLMLLILITFQTVIPIRRNCDKPKDSGYNCVEAPSEPKQYFYYNPKWNACFAFKYLGCGGNENRFRTRSLCEQSCFYADGSACVVPGSSTKPLVSGEGCNDTVCPAEYECVYGFFPECCNSTIRSELMVSYAKKCPDGSAAGGVQGDYFMATFASSCSDLICESHQHCVQVSKHFAKCCAKNY